MTEVYAVALAALLHGAAVVAVGNVCGHRLSVWRILPAAAAGGAYAALCVADPRMGEGWVRALSLLLIAALTFGRKGKAVACYVALFLSVEGLAGGAGRYRGWLGALAVAVFLLLAGRSRRDRVPVVLRLGDRQVKVTALRDTGNTLRDPVSGTPVLILDGGTACRLTGLERAQLKTPVEVMRRPPFPGLRLIPYRAVGVADGLLLGMCLHSVRVGSWKGSLTVAFAPEDFSENGEFQALTGGSL